MLTPSYLAGVAEPMVKLWSQLERDIMADLAKRIVKMGGVSETSDWQIRKLREMGMMEDQLTKQLKKLTNMSDRELKAAVKEACSHALASDDALYKAAGLSPVPLTASPALQEVILAGVRKTQGLMKNFTGTTAKTASKAFENSLDQAYIQIVSGAYSPDQAIRRAIDRLASQGMESVAYPTGHIERLESATRRAIMTGCNQTTAELQLARMTELETDLVETTSHAGARPTHAVWQGRIFSISGKTKGYGDFYAETGYGSGDGLCGWNCYHSFYPYILGFSTPSFSRDPAADSGKNNDDQYELGQIQRGYERQIRQAKRECSTLDAAMASADSDELVAQLKADFSRASVKLKAREAKLKTFVREHNLQRDTLREYSAGWSRSTSSKTVWANRKSKATGK